MGFWNRLFGRRETLQDSYDRGQKHMREFLEGVNERLEDIGHPGLDPDVMFPRIDVKEQLDWSFLDSDDPYSPYRKKR